MIRGDEHDRWGEQARGGGRGSLGGNCIQSHVANQAWKYQKLKKVQRKNRLLETKLLQCQVMRERGATSLKALRSCEEAGKDYAVKKRGTWGRGPLEGGDKGQMFFNDLRHQK